MCAGGLFNSITSLWPVDGIPKLNYQDRTPLAMTGPKYTSGIALFIKTCCIAA